MLKATRHPERQPPLFITKLVVSVQYCYFVVLALARLFKVLIMMLVVVVVIEIINNNNKGKLFVLS